jgi:hypothetical protein
MNELPIIQKTHDLIQWYVPILNQLPRDHKFLLGDRIISGLYDLLEGFIKVRFSKEKLPQLQSLNTQLDIYCLIFSYFRPSAMPTQVSTSIALAWS